MAVGEWSRVTWRSRDAVRRMAGDGDLSPEGSVWRMRQHHQVMATVPLAGRSTRQEAGVDVSEDRSGKKGGRDPCSA